MDENQFSELPPDLLIHIPQIEFLYDHNYVLHVVCMHKKRDGQIKILFIILCGHGRSLTGNQLMGLPDGIFANATELTHL